MQLSEHTLEILKNFSSLNTGIMFRKGNILRTINPGKQVVAEATIDEEIPATFGIYELNQLLSILSIHKTPPELYLDGNNLIIQGYNNRSKITYRCCNEEMIKTPPEGKELSLPKNDNSLVSFLLSEDDFNWVLKAASVLASPNIAVTGKDGKLFIGASDSADDSAHTNNLEIDNYSGDPVSFVYKTENWKMLPGPYKVTISAKGISLFEHAERKLQYWVALEAKKA